MPKQITVILDRMKATGSRFSGPQITLGIIGIAVLVLGGTALGTFLTKPSYVPLFTGLSSSDASSITEQLTSSAVPYELTDGGATILVPEENVYQERLAAAAAGLPASDTGGYSLLDTMGVTSSEFQQSITYKRALEGELAATIGAMKGVNTASVKLAIPEETVFVATEVAPTASVFIETKRGETLSSDQVQAIVHLTSASIDGMSATDVAVIDSKGTVLSSVGGVAGSSSSDAEETYELSTQAAVQAMLDKILGPGKSTVVVSATVSQESAEVLSEIYDVSETKPVTSESTETEEYTGNGDNSTGVLGPDNIAVPGDGGDAGAYENTKSVKDNAVNKVTESRIVPAGAIDRQAISVAVDEAAGQEVGNAKVQALVEAAVGADEERGDMVTVETVSFSKAASDEAANALKDAQAEKDAARTQDLIRTAIIAGAIAIPLLILGIILFARRSRQSRVEVDVEDDSARDLSEAFTVPEPVVEKPTITTIPDTELSETEIKRAEIDNLAGQDPSKTASFLRGVMNERPTNR